MKNNSAPSFRIWDKALQRWVEDYSSGTHAFIETYLSLSGSVIQFSAGFPERDGEPLFSVEKDAFFIKGNSGRTQKDLLSAEELA